MSIAKMRKFRCKLPNAGNSWVEVEAENADLAMDEAARKYGHKNWEEMRKYVQKYSFNGLELPDDFGFAVELVREEKT